LQLVEGGRHYDHEFVLKSISGMIDPDISKYAELLKQQYIFLGLDEAQLAHVVTRFQRVELGADEIIYSQGDPGDSFYVVYMGRVRILHMDGAQERQLRIISIGDYFGEEALLFDRQRTDTAVTMEPCILLRLEREAFLELMELAPGIRMNLSATAESRYIAQKEKFDWLGEDEVIYLICRKHWYFLILSLFSASLWTAPP
jgi:signal-transduction protein with cAMP-binding, CBS, and nucleotidyltransferase domain